MSAFRNPQPTSLGRVLPIDLAAGTAAVRQPERHTPARVGRYDIESEIGNGLLVRVFRAFDQSTARPVTLKVITGAADESAIERFRSEVSTAARLRHPGIVAIYELGEHNGLPFAATQHMEGEDLGTAMRTQRSLSLLQKVLIMQQVAGAVQAMHRAGIQHVCLRPSGIALGSKASAIVQDFGIVRLVGGQSDESSSYQSPEEGDSEFPPDALSDIFSFGLLYLELVVGRHPFRDAPATLREAAPECPEALARLLRRALEKRRELRYESFEEIQYDAEPILGELKRTRAAVLLANARRMVSVKESEAAQAVLRDVLDLDPGNRHARRLLTSVREEIQRELTRTRVAALSREADAAVANREFERAAEILESARQLDNENAEIQGRLERMKVRLERSRRAAELTGQAHQLLQQGSLTDALDRITQALEADGQTPGGAELLRAIRSALERQTRLRNRVAEARTLVAQQNFAAAIEILEALQAEFPEQKDLAGELAQAKERMERAAFIRCATEESDRLRRAEQFEQAIQVVEGALAKYRGDAALVARRRELEDEWQEFKLAAAVRQVLEEARWLEEQDRPDLAAQLLREKSSECADHADLVARLAAVEKVLAEWEKRRFIAEAMGRIAALEQLQQWAVALTVAEEASQTCPDSPELHEAGGRLRGLLQEQVRRNKLARRVELIRQKIATQSWQQALSLLAAARAEFPGESELESLSEQVEAGRRASDIETIVAQVRQCLADGELGQAETMLREGMEGRDDQPQLAALREELEAEKRYRTEWQSAQIHFSRRQFAQAEEILERLAASGRTDAKTLLDTVRAARAASEEDQFRNRGREKAVKLIQEQQFQQAADLLRNLLALFPGDAILERDLHSALSAMERGHEPAPAAPPEQQSKPTARLAETDAKDVAPLPRVPRGGLPAVARLRTRPVMMVAAALLLLVSATAAVWRISRSAAAAPATPNTPLTEKKSRTAPAPVAAPAAPQSPAPQPAVAEPAARVERPVVSSANTDSRSVTRPTRPFSPPSQSASSAVTSSAVIPPPSAAVPGAVATQAPALPGGASAPVTLPAPPPRSEPVTQAPAENVVKAPVGGNFREAKLISAPPAVYPQVARDRGVSGSVTLEATLDKQGKVSAVKVINGHALLVPFAREAVLKRRYEPATLNGQPIEVTLSIKVVFGPGRK